MNENYNDFISSIKNDELDKTLNQAKEERTKGKKKAKRIIITVDSIIGLMVILFVCMTNEYALISIPFVLAMMTIIDLIISSLCNNSENAIKYNELYKEKIVDGILKNFFYDVDYIPKREMPRGVYDKATGETYDIYYSDDYIEGLIDNKYKIKMAEVKTEKIKEEKDSKGNVEKRHYILFSGLFTKIDLNKSINGDLIIAEGTIYRSYRNNSERLKMDSSEFEKIYNVFTNNKIVAMQILTPDIMEMILEFRNKYDKAFDVIIDKDTMYIRLHVGQIFETYINDNSRINDATTEEYFNLVKFVYMFTTSIIETINNTEI